MRDEEVVGSLDEDGERETRGVAGARAALVGAFEAAVEVGRVAHYGIVLGQGSGDA